MRNDYKEHEEIVLQATRQLHKGIEEKKEESTETRQKLSGGSLRSWSKRDCLQNISTRQNYLCPNIGT